MVTIPLATTVDLILALIDSGVKWRKLKDRKVINFLTGCSKLKEIR